MPRTLTFRQMLGLVGVHVATLRANRWQVYVAEQTPRFGTKTIRSSWKPRGFFRHLFGEQVLVIAR